MRLTRRLRQQAPLKQWCLSTRKCSITSQLTVISVTTVRTSYITLTTEGWIPNTNIYACMHTYIHTFHVIKTVECGTSHKYTNIQKFTV